MVFCGSTSGAMTTLNIRALFVKQLTLQGSYMGNLPELKKIIKLFSQGKLKPVVDSVFQLKDAAMAQKRMLARKHFGKIVLEA